MSGVAVETQDVVDLTHLVQDEERPPPPSLADGRSPWIRPSDEVLRNRATSTPPTKREGWESLVEELADESQRCEDTELRGALMSEAGRILIDWLGRTDEGELLLRRSRSPLADIVHPTHGDAESLAAELSQLESEATHDGRTPAERAAAWIEFGALCEERAHTKERALDAYESALELVPQDGVASLLAARCAQSVGKFDVALRHLDVLTQLSTSATHRAVLWLRAASIAPDPDARIDALLRAREEFPHEGVLRALVAVFEDTHRLQDLGAIYLELARCVSDPRSIAQALHLAFAARLEAGQPVHPVIAEILRQVGDDERVLEFTAPLADIALHLMQWSAEIDSSFEDRAPEQVGRWLDSALDDRREQALLRAHFARLLPDHEHEVGPESGSSLEDDLRFCEAQLPEHQWVHEALATLLEKHGDTAGLLEHLQRWSRTQDAGPGRAAVLRRLGQAYETQAHDLPRAAETYELAVAEDPENPDGLRALGRAYDRMRRWDRTVESLRAQADHCDDPLERLAALRRIAVIAEHELGDVELAIRALLDVMAHDPDDLLSVFQLVRLCRSFRDAHTLVVALRHLVARTRDPVSRTSLLTELGEAQEHEVAERDRARKSYQQALSLGPGYAPALGALRRLHTEDGNFEALLELLDPAIDPDTDPATLALVAGRVCYEELQDASRAIPLLRSAYELDPELVSARELLLDALMSTGDLPQAYDLLRAQDVPSSDAFAADHHYRLGLLAESSAPPSDRPEDAPPQLLADALQHYRAALDRQPDHGLAFERARHLLVFHNDADNLVLLLEAHLPGTHDAERTVEWVQLGRVHAAQDDVSTARRAYDEALSLSPDDPIVRHEFEGLLRLMGDRGSLPALYLRSARDTSDPHLKATFLVEGAELLLSTGESEDHELAGRAILEALQVDPGNPYAVRHLERLLSDPESPFVVKDAVSARAVRAQSDAERAIFYVESAELLERVGAWGQARRAYVAAKAALPNLAPADLGLGRTGDDQRRAATAGPGRTSIHVLLTEARDASMRSGRGDAAGKQKALQIIGEVLSRDPQNRDALALARNLVGQPGDPAPVLHLLAQAFSAVKDPDLRYELGLFLGEHSPSLDEAVRYFQSATQARPNGRRALRGLVNAYRQMGNDRMAATATERLLELFEPAEPSAIDLRIGIANFLSTSHETLPRALEHARIVLAARPNEPRAVALMAELLERSGQKVEAAHLIDRLVARERNRDRLHDLFLRKAKLLSGTPKTSAEALKAIERAAALSPGNRDTITLLVDQLSLAGQTGRVATYLPPIRNALQANVSRGAVSMRDLNLLAKVAAPQASDLAGIATALIHAFDGKDPTGGPKPEQAHASALRRLLDNGQLRSNIFYAGEPAALHNLLLTLDGAVSRMAREFPEVGNEETPAPEAAHDPSLRRHARTMAEVVRLLPPRLASSPARHAVLVLQDPVSTVRFGEALWKNGNPEAWRGLVDVAVARAALGASRARALSPQNLDLLIAAAFKITNVFNPTTPDPDPQRLASVVTSLGNALPRRQRSAVDAHCRALASHPFDTDVAAKATTSTDLRFAALISGAFGDCLAGACLLDGVVGGTLKQRVGRSKLARGLLAYIISDEFLAARRLVLQI